MLPWSLLPGAGGIVPWARAAGVQVETPPASRLTTTRVRAKQATRHQFACGFQHCDAPSFRLNLAIQARSRGVGRCGARINNAPKCGGV